MATPSVVNVDDARVGYRLRGRDPAVGAMCQQIGAGHLTYFKGAVEFLSLATEFCADTTREGGQMVRGLG